MSEEVAVQPFQPPMAPPPVDTGWGNAPTLAPPKSPFDRPLAAIRRYKWLLIGVVLVAVGIGFVATRFVVPEYEVRATIWIASETPQGERGGPIRSSELLNSAAWTELAKSYRISDAVVKKLSLYLTPSDPQDSTYFRDFTVADRFVPGTYKLSFDKKLTKWRLAVNDVVSDSGAVGDSIGRRMGLHWLPAPNLVGRLAGKDLSFAVATPRETSVDLLKRLTTRLPEKSNFMWLQLHDPNPELAARTLNAWTNEYVSVAGDLKRKNLVEFANILGGQLQFAETALRDAEAALENFRVNTITLPAEGAPVAAGLEMTRDPAMKSFFDKKTEYDNLRHDREALEKIVVAMKAGDTTVPYESILLIPSVVNNPSGTQMQLAFTNLYKAQADLAAARQVYTDNYPAVKDLIANVNNIRNKTLPMQAGLMLAQLKERERDYAGRISSQSADIQSIPVRTIEEMRLRRAVTVSEGLYTTLKSKYAESKLAEASAAPDVSIMDSATVPFSPTKNTAPRIMGVAVVAGLAVALGLALLLDAMDKRIRYPEQAATELGLPISGTVPLLPKGGVHSQSPEQISQLVESFRTLRMNVMNAGGRQVSLAVSSPSPGDGKSFIASNLAMSFADLGFRTILVDGDTRRGALQDMFGLKRSPGLTDYLSGETDSLSIVHPTGHDNLSLIPTGTPRRRSPELLTGPALNHLVSELRARYDVVIFDTPPLAAGVDGYAIAAATGSLLVVLRIGQTERRMAAAKLLLVDRLPINVVGSVLNAAPSQGEYEYYGYVGGYGTEELEPGQQVAQITG